MRGFAGVCLIALVLPRRPFAIKNPTRPSFRPSWRLTSLIYIPKFSQPPSLTPFIPFTPVNHPFASLTPFWVPTYYTLLRCYVNIVHSAHVLRITVHYVGTYPGTLKSLETRVQLKAQNPDVPLELRYSPARKSISKHAYRYIHICECESKLDVPQKWVVEFHYIIYMPCTVFHVKNSGIGFF